MERLEEITREVDELISTFKTLQENGSKTDFSAFKDLINRRISKLLEIYKENDMDERVVIVQFQRIKLSKLLREVESMELSTQPPSIATYNGNHPESNANYERPNSPIRLPMQFHRHFQQVSTHHRPSLGVVNRHDCIEKESPSKTAKNNATKKKIKPLYEWEVRNISRAPPVKNISHSLPNTSPLSQMVEFNIVLSPAEYGHLQDQQWGYLQNGTKLPTGFNFLHKNTGHLAYFVKEENINSPYLASSTPYVDPTYHLPIRPTIDRTKWVSSQDFK